MANIAPGLNFRIGADTKGIDRAIREAEKSLRGAVSSFSSIGNSLSLALSAPLAAFAGLSVKAAGDVEGLRLALEGTMKGAGRSIGEARAELEELRKAALAPGLDFEQAVRGSIRLQNVGYSAEAARDIIVQLANALTLSGGTADQLDGVTKQFAQMAGKGKIMQEDLTIILENMPALSKVMRDTFGTTNAEMLRGMGVSVEDFISKLTTGMAALPRAQGGIANAIVNAQNAVKQAIASVGEELNKTFNVSGKLEDFAKWITGLAKAFSELDEGTKRLIVGIGVFAAALGPAFKIMQGGVFVVGQLRVMFLSLQKVLAQSLAGQAIPSLIGKWRALDFAMKASIIGGIAAVVLAAAAAFAVMTKDMSAATQAARQVEKTQKAAVESISKERAEIELNTRIAKDATKTKAERLAAMDRLIAISPEYRKALKGETIDTEALNKTTSALVGSMIRAATVRKATEDIASLDEELRNLSENSDPTFWQNMKNAGESALQSFVKIGTMTGGLKALREEISGTGDGFNTLTGAQDRYNAQTQKNFEEQKAGILARREALMKLAEENLKVDATTQKVTTSTGEATKASSVYKEVISDIANISARQDLLGSDKIVDQAKAIEGGILKLLDNGFRPMSKEVQGLKAQMQGLFTGIKMPELPRIASPGVPTAVKSETDPFKGAANSALVATDGLTRYLSVAEQIGEVNKQVQLGMISLGEAMRQLGAISFGSGLLMQSMAINVAGAMTEFAEQGGSSLKELAKVSVAAAAKTVRAYIQQGVTAAAMRALEGVPFPFNIAAAAVAGAAASTLFNGLIKSIGIPALADGGVLTSPQLVLAGEYPGARSNPEIVAPESKLRDIFRGEMRGNGGGGVLTCRVSGDDLLFVLDKAEYKAKRAR